ncbi:helix-turn-helix domain-containing protein [Enterococcus faecalis]|uniref:helix-turn-helix domain-containing protein n=1 Tax=Enterococcus faecalis TaxID=1351 RepID=UPI001386DB1D|nr:helix-turn-helix transcriptional regulator [Enterococcus faecalis]MEB7427879.1 helix-turn-helix domain-containing protein [Enterococcus faecalis]
MNKAMCTYKPFDQLIESRGLRYDFVAKKMGICPNYLYRLRCNPLRMNIKHMESLASVLGVDFFVIYEVRKNFKNEVDKNATKEERQPA